MRPRTPEEREELCDDLLWGVACAAAVVTLVGYALAQVLGLSPGRWLL